MTIEYTSKSISKVQKWANVSEESAKKLIRRAAVNGTELNNLPVRERDFCISQLTHDNRTLVVHAGLGFIFTPEFCCVNIFRLPKWFGKTSLYHSGKKQLRNPKKFYKFNLQEEMLSSDYTDIAA